MGARSVGCMTCKARHVKCDNSLPSCQRCLKVGRTCEYASKFSFIDDGIRTERRLRRHTAQSQRHLVLQHSCHHNMYHAGGLMAPTSDPTRSAHLASFKDTLYLSFLVKKFKYEQIGHSPILNIHENTPTSYAAISALAGLVFGQAHRSTEIVLESRRAYGRCLLLLQKDILDPMESLSLSTLESVAALCMYEGIDQRASQSWYHHANGLARLMQSRGPTRYQNKLDNTFFRVYRAMLVQKAILSGETTFLSHAEWKTLPWDGSERPKDTCDELIDILCDIATYQAEVKACVENSRIPRLCEIEIGVSALCEKLDIWWKEWWSDNNQSCAVKDLPETAQSTSHNVFDGSCLEFDNIRSAYLIATYDTIRILLLVVLQIVHRYANSHVQTSSDKSYVQQTLRREADPNHYPLCGLTSNIKMLAREICMILEYCSRAADQNYSFNFSCIIALDTAYACFEPDSPEAQWILSRTLAPAPPLLSRSAATSTIQMLSSCQLNQDARRELRIAHQV